MVDLTSSQSVGAAIGNRLGEIIADFETASRRLDTLLPQLRLMALGEMEILRGAETRPPTQDEALGWEEQPSADGEHREVELRVEEGTVDQLLQLQEQLSRIPGISGITVTGVGEGRAGLLVHLGARDPVPSGADEGPTIVCVMCGRTINVGSAAISHGLCPSCTTSYLKGEAPRPL